MFFQSIAVAALAATANAHIIMKQPVPYSKDKIDNSPITMAQFPCKSQNGFTVTEMNPMTVGEEQTIKFDGTAVHGGGSCQLSVTMDLEPTPQSVFKVIKSIEGGCPGIEGNTTDYTYTLPDSIPTGKATFAWTWFSKQAGNFELYMNCAPIDVSGGASDDSAFQKLPDMLVANLDRDVCHQVTNQAIKFPNPGTSVEVGTTNDAVPPVGPGCGASGPAPPVGGSPSASPPAGGAPTASPPAGGAPTASPPSYGEPSVAPPAEGAPSVAPTTPPVAAPTAAPQPTAAPSAAPEYPGGEFAPGAGASTKTTLVTVTGSPSKPTVPLGTGTPSKPTASLGTTTPAKPSSAPAAPPAAAPPATPPTAGNTACSEDGAIVCNGETQFGLCNHGQVVWQAVAAGTKCSNGVISKRGYNGRIARPRRHSAHRL
jgi:hypothetical protein